MQLLVYFFGNMLGVVKGQITTLKNRVSTLREIRKKKFKNKTEQFFFSFVIFVDIKNNKSKNTLSQESSIEIALRKKMKRCSISKADRCF